MYVCITIIGSLFMLIVIFALLAETKTFEALDERIAERIRKK